MTYPPPPPQRRPADLPATKLRAPRRWWVGAVIGAVIGAAIFSITLAAILHNAPATKTTIIDPITDVGLASGWTVEPTERGPLDCAFSGPHPSPNAVGPGTYWCGATADSASACWPSPKVVDELWCVRSLEPDSPTLFSVAATGVDGTTPVPDDPVPLFVELTDGSKFWYRIGGSWPGRSDGLIAAYGCGNHLGVCSGEEQQVILGEESDNDEFHIFYKADPAWTVEVGDLNYEKSLPPRTMRVVRVWFIAGAH